MVVNKIKSEVSEEERREKLKKEKNVKSEDMFVGKWVKCKKCKEILYKEDLEKNFNICPNCGNYFRLSARKRIHQIIDEGTFEEYDRDMQTKDPIKFEGYMHKIKALQEKTQIKEAVMTGKGRIQGEEVIIAVMDANFFMGSMGSVVGEKITRAIEKSIELKLPFVIFCTSGGARMQEGIISLMQMAKTSAALAKLDEARILNLTILTDPTTGGVTASFASLGDIILAEPEALVGFAGPRVIKQTINQELPEGFQRSEFLLEHGFIDKIVERKNMKDTIYKILLLHEN